jgi:hypothetical protein
MLGYARNGSVQITGDRGALTQPTDSSMYQVRQREFCYSKGVDFCASDPDSKLGMSDNLRKHIIPVNGLRHEPAGETNGWYIWGGNEFLAAENLFQPIHLRHIDIICPAAMTFLGLPPGWRFLVAPNYEDVWFDAPLLTDKPII